MMSNKKKILFILPSLAVGGLERVQVTIANKLVANGYQVTIQLLENAKELADELDPKIRLKYKPRKHQLGEIIPYIRRKFYDDGMWETRASPRKLYEYYVGDENYDVEIGFFRGLPVKIISGSTNSHAVHLAWVHNDFHQCGGYQSQFSSLKQVQEAYRKMDHVICVSHQAEQGFKEVIGDLGNTLTIYNMIPINRIRGMSMEFVGKSPAGKMEIVIVGRLLDKAKGHKRLISAVCRLHAEAYKIHMTIVGGGPDEQMLRRRVMDLDAEKIITMVGSVKNPYPYIKRADLLVCASYYEGYNLTVAEALICGTPVLSTDCTGPNEILDGGKYGMIVENSEEGLYHGLQKVLDQPKLLQEYSRRAIDRQNFFNEERIIGKIVKQFQKE